MKTNITNSEYQASFLPLIERTETEIKKIILNGALVLKSKYEIRQKISALIHTLSRKLPKNLKDKDLYIEGLYMYSEREIRKVYDELTVSLSILVALLLANRKKKNKGSFIANITNKQVLTPKQALKQIHEGKITDDDLNVVKSEMIKYHAKGTPYVKDYEKLVKSKVNELAQSNVLVGGGETRAISIWQKAELDIRHDEQMSKLNDMIASGEQYAVLSSHPDCSKRCEPWQGKIVDIQSPIAELSGFRMNKRINGQQVYCLNEIIKQVDKYGYTNNILVGFNCRHHLLKLGEQQPNKYSKKDIEKQRKINANLRAMERKIRYLRQKALLFKECGDKKNAKLYADKANELIEAYKRYAEKNGYAWHDYRIKI